jgi:hypothetical protein
MYWFENRRNEYGYVWEFIQPTQGRWKPTESFDGKPKGF